MPDNDILFHVIGKHLELFKSYKQYSRHLKYEIYATCKILLFIYFFFLISIKMFSFYQTRKV